MNKIVLIVLVSVIFGACNPKISQQASGSGERQGGPSSLNPVEQRQANRYGQPQKERFLWIFKRKKKVDWGDQLIAEYEQRMKDNAKEAKKKAKEMKKPQYSDPTYFGHKRKPKKRPPHKMKYCEECGIRH